MKKLALALALLATPAASQDYHAPNRDQWIGLVRALQDVPMSASAHQQMIQILARVQQEAAGNAKQVQAPSKPDGSGSAQPEVRKEGGSAPKGGAGVPRR